MRREFFECIRDLYFSDVVQAMGEISQHVPTVNCLEHSLFVSFVSYRMAKKRGLDYRAAARGALLHDMFLYDQHEKDNFVGRHAAYHPLAALKMRRNILRFPKWNRIALKTTCGRPRAAARSLPNP